MTSRNNPFLRTFHPKYKMHHKCGITLISARPHNKTDTDCLVVIKALLYHIAAKVLSHNLPSHKELKRKALFIYHKENDSFRFSG